MSIIENIHDLFVEEAKQSPLLFNDLASMENYISESYAGRSIIELLQNADDAQARRVFIKKLNDKAYVVANDGRVFSNDDLLALCRSGASTKRRASDTIGYRGIGFKSVVNYANVVHLVSGNIQTTFSRELTLQELPNAGKTPLIRIPHVFSGYTYADEIGQLIREGFSTVFIFEVKSNAFLSEMEEFTSDVLIFLKWLQEVVVVASTSKQYWITRSVLGQAERSIAIKETGRESKWLVFDSSEQNGKASIAFKFDGKQAIPAEFDEAVIHSFLPTNDKLSVKCKINGDFSTDPSRTRIVQDDATKVANNQCSKLVADIYEKCFLSGHDKYRIVSILKNASVDPLSRIKGESPNDIIVKGLFEEIKKRMTVVAKGKRIVLQPDGITNTDFEKIGEELGVFGIGGSLEENIPGLRAFLNNVGIDKLSVEESLKALKDVECSDTTRTTIIAETIKATKLGVTNKQKELIENAKLFKFVDGVKTIKAARGSKVEEVFEGAVTEKLVSQTDYTMFAKRIGLDESQLALNNKKEVQEHVLPGRETSSHMSFGSNRVVKKWRTVEENVAAVIELMEGVSSVKDVSKQNIGYDLEATFLDGSRRFYEVKSVDNLGDEISFTNNEYSTCVSLKAHYYLAIATQSSTGIQICFIKNPVDTLRFEKRVTRWEWMCNEYSGEVVKYLME